MVQFKQTFIQLILLLLTLTSCQQNHAQTTPERLTLKAKEALTYCKQHHMNTSFCILVDMRIHSGKNRLFVWDFNTNKVVNEGICSHGSCDGKTGTGGAYKLPKFSNTSGSYCSSLGKYKIGKRSYSNWGINIHYKLHGLENANNNAFKRVVVLHSFNAVPDTEIYPQYAVNSWGCPMVSNTLMRDLDAQLKKVKQPVLLWVFH